MGYHIAVIDYGSGNLHSVAKALEAVAPPSTHIRLCQTASDVKKADAIVLPGVGAFEDCYNSLMAAPDLYPILQRQVLEKGRPFLGICVGMQLLADWGAEAKQSEKCDGLGWIGGKVKPLDAGQGYKIPNMGWHPLQVTNANPLFAGLNGAWVYFVHSYIFHAKRQRDIAAQFDYGQPCCAAVARDNIAGVQFHPEKSQAAGLTILERFTKWRP